MIRRALWGALGLLVVLPALFSLYLAYPPSRALWEYPAAYDLPARSVTFSSSGDRTRLSGWWIPAATPGAPAVILVHGFSNNRLIHGRGLPLARVLHTEGYSVLLFEMRGHGSSERRPVTFGMAEQEDVAGAVAFVRTQGAGQVVLYGFSTGGAAALLAAATDPAIAAVIADSVYPDFDELLTLRVKARGYAQYLAACFSLLSGYDPASTAPADAVARLAPRPVLIIHGTDDRVIPVAQSRVLYGAAAENPRAELLIVPGARHTHGYETDPASYVARVMRFLRQALPNTETDPFAPGAKGSVISGGVTAKATPCGWRHRLCAGYCGHET